MVEGEGGGETVRGGGGCRDSGGRFWRRMRSCESVDVDLSLGW